MQPLVAKYINSPPLSLPFWGEQTDLTLEKYEIVCKTCGKPTQQLRGRITEYHSCIEVDAAGWCKPCNIICWSQYRWYTDNRLLYYDGRTWRSSRMVEANPPWWRRVAVWFGWIEKR